MDNHECPYKAIVDEIKKECSDEGLKWTAWDYNDVFVLASKIDKILEKHGVK